MSKAIGWTWRDKGYPEGLYKSKVLSNSVTHSKFEADRNNTYYEHQDVVKVELSTTKPKKYQAKGWGLYNKFLKRLEPFSDDIDNTKANQYQHEKIVRVYIKVIK